MDEKIDKIIALAGNENRYQYFTLVVIVFLWINCNIICIFIPYLEREPIVNYIDKYGNRTENATINNDICPDIKSYNIVESYDYSWVIEYGIECDQLSVSLLGSFAFVGNALGDVVFSIINKFLAHKKINNNNKYKK